uniref:t-SNARE coiled-coil homology domain-containing protein n=1 Tax=Eutreptiella gymnastica TaxID=73025 RepID=A0A7S1J642_9EUGL|mmetsp:Transcript_71206/g.125257  ORF Transcript_71206/g.125257 Transcript_71206/m.125257 type:complete len:133 (+) Transcript_71206:558-956(+)
MNNRSAIDEEQERDEKMQKYVAQGFSQEQIDALLLNEQMVNERDAQLQNIYSNIVDLHSMFKDLNALVIDQGTLLDRIDHNVEETKTQILKANKELEATAKLAKKSKFVMIVMILVVLIIAMLFALLLKVVI